MEKFSSYFEMLKIKGQLLERINEFYKYYSKVCPEEIEDIFISEYVQEDGKRVLDSMFLFSKNFIMEAKNFRTECKFDINRYKDSIKYIEISMSDYDFEKATIESRMSVEVGFPSMNMDGIFKASGENCDVLKELLLDRFKDSL